MKQFNRPWEYGTEDITKKLIEMSNLRDEGLPHAIMDYHSSIGSVLDFTADDESVAKENSFSMEDVIELCERDPDTGVTIEMYREAQLLVNKTRKLAVI